MTSSFLRKNYAGIAAAFFVLLAGCATLEAPSGPTPFPYTPPPAFSVLGGTLEVLIGTPDSTATAAAAAAAATLPPATPAPSQTATRRPVQATATKTTQAAEPTPTRTPPAAPVTTLLFTGQIVPARCVQAAVDARGSADFIYAQVRDLLTAPDLTIGTLNASLSDVAPKTGCISTFVLTGSPNNADAMAAAGFDVMSVATNHIKNCGPSNCGDQAFVETLFHLNRVGIAAVGAGSNLEMAARPVVLTVHGVRFGFVSLGQIEPMAFAGENQPGIASLTPESLTAAIAAARAAADVVIVLPHWGPEYASVPNPLQQYLGRLAVEAGADLVVGNHTHVVQAHQQIDGVNIFYGLGNFVFDQTWDRLNQESVMLRVTFTGTQVTGYELVPVVTTGEGEVSLADEATAAEILGRIASASAVLP